MSRLHAWHVPEPMGIYRGEVYEIMFALADLKAGLVELIEYLRETMAKKRRKMFETQEEYEAWRKRSDEVIAMLRRRAEMIKAELDAWHREQGKPAG